MSPARTVLLALLLLLLTAPAGANAAGSTDISFENLAPGTQLEDQYAAQDVRFGSPLTFGLSGDSCGATTIVSPGVYGRSASIGHQQGEFKGLCVSSAFEFGSERRAVSFNLKAVGLDQPVKVSIHAIGGATLATRTLNLPAGQVVAVPFTRPTPDIISVSILGGTGFNGATSNDDHVYLDDVSAPIEDNGTISPKFSLTLLQPRADVVEGSSVTVPVRVNRYNGSIGPVQVGIDSLPAGVSGTQLTPNPVTGRDTAQLRVFAGSPMAGDRQLTVSASKPAGAPASVGVPVGASVVQTVHGIPALAFTDRAAAEQVFTPGCGFAPTETVKVRGGFSGKIGLSSKVIAGPVQPLQASTLTATADGDLEFPYPVPFTGPGSGVLRLTLSPDRATTVTRDVPVRVAAPIASVTPSVAKTPQAGQEGTVVTLRGEGFCGSANTRVRFGNTMADAPILTRNPQGTEITARVPRLATTGPVQLVPDVTNAAIPVLNGPSITVDSYRNTAGFAFRNYTPHLTVDQMSTTFGPAATHLSVDACGLFSFGGISCRIISPIPDPWAMIVLGIANVTMGGSSGGGACFGFSRTSEQIRLGRRGLTRLGNDAATRAFDLPGPGGANGSLTEAINANQLAQFSGEYAGLYLAHSIAGQVTAQPASLRNDLVARLRSNDYPILSLRTGGTVDKLHSVVAYDIEDDPAQPGAYYIDVYDSNQPFVVPGYVQKGKPVAGDENTNGSYHAQRTLNSRIHVRANGSWNLPSSSMSATSLGNIIVGGIDDPPARPKLITGIGVLKGGVTALFGSAAGALVRSADDDDLPPSSATTQISAGDRHLYSEPGVLEPDRARALNATPWLPATGAASGNEGFLLDAGADAAYTVELQGESSGSQTRTLLGEGLALQATAPSRPGTTDKLDLKPADARVGFTSGGGAVPVTLQTMARREDGSTRGAALTVSGSGRDSIGFDAGRNVVELEHAGKPATVRLTLSSFGKTAPQSAQVSVRVGRGRTTLRPGSWTGLRGGAVRVRSGGKSRKVKLRVRTVRGATLSAPAISRRGARTVSVKVKVPSRLVAGSTNVVYAVTRGKKVVASTSLPVGDASARTLTWTVPKKVRRGDRVAVIATSLAQRGTQFDSAVSRRTARIRR